MDCWVSGSMDGSGQITNNLINLDIIEIIQFCLKTNPWVGVSLQIINLQTELNYLDYVKIY